MILAVPFLPRLEEQDIRCGLVPIPEGPEGWRFFRGEFADATDLPSGNLT